MRLYLFDASRLYSHHQETSLIHSLSSIDLFNAKDVWLESLSQLEKMRRSLSLFPIDAMCGTVYGNVTSTVLRRLLFSLGNPEQNVTSLLTPPLPSVRASHTMCSS